MIVNKILLGDAYELIKDIPDNSIDLVYTDIPYLHIKGGTGCSDLGKQAKKLKDSIEAFNKGIDYSILDEFKRVLKKVNMFIWCSDEQIFDILSWAKDYYFDILPWCKTNPPPYTNNTWLSDVEYCIYIRESNVPFSSDYSLKHKWFVSSTNVSDKVLFEHPTIKPFELVKKHILNVTNEGDIVLDPFCGSGTTPVVCKDINRSFVAFEINPDFYKIAIDRLDGIDTNGRIYMLLR